MICKLQYKTFEPGEFVNERPVSYAEAVAIIESFPWEHEREKTVIDLTNPSITFQSDSGRYLKLASYYNKKFILYGFDGKRLYQKAFHSLAETYSLLEKFFLKNQLEEHDLKLQPTPFKNIAVHFKTQDFHYAVTSTTALSFFLKSSGINVFCGLLMILAVVLRGLSGFHQASLSAFLFVLITFFIVGGGCNIIFFYHYYQYAKGKVFIASKGADTFYFGDEERPEAYSKKDILKIIIYKHGRASSRRNPLDDFQLFKFCFKNFAVVVPSFFVDDFQIQNKFQQVTIDYWSVYLAWINKKVLKPCELAD